MTRSRRIRVALSACAALGVALLLGGPSPAAAAAGTESSTEVNAFSGAFQTRVPIGAPAFHGLEPKLAVQYSSQAGNGTAGLGWALAGVSAVERAAPGHGTPHYDGTDVFTLDGVELIPSCGTFGGSHCTRIESYQRITWDAGANRWYVWAKDGTKSTYVALLNTAKGTYRWAVAEVRDPRGNAVAYNYFCGGGDCYLDTVAYNGAYVKLYWEGRTDTVTYAIGGQDTCYNTCYQTCYAATCCDGTYDKYGNCVATCDKYGTCTQGSYPCQPYNCSPYNCMPYACGAGGIATTAYRLKSVDVVVGGSRARAYKLGYGTSDTSLRSILTSLQQFGRDAAVDGSGNVSGGTALPALTAGWSAGAPGLVDGFGTTGIWDWGYTDRRWFVDINGDGRSDYCRAVGNSSGAGSYLSCALATGSGFADAAFVAPLWDWGYAERRWFVDVNGDGKADYCRATGTQGGSGSYLTCSLSTGTAFSDIAVALWDWGYTDRRWFVDINGDGKADYCRAVGNSSGAGSYLSCAVATGTSFVDGGYVAALAEWGYTDRRWFVDVDGDGKSDYCRATGTESGAGSQLTCSLSTGTGLRDVTIGMWDWGYIDRRWFVDINGDGRRDYCRAVGNTSGSGSYLSCALATGTGFIDGGFVAAIAEWGYSDRRWFVDVNNDGRADYCRATGAEYGAGSYMTCALSGAGGLREVSTQVWDWGYSDRRWFVDMSGDGKSDYCRAVGTESGAGSYITCGVGGPNGTSEVVTSLANGLGGTTSIAYTPSSTWTGSALLEGMILQTVSSVTVSDGRGDAQTTTYAYQGARWNGPDRELLGFRKATTTLAATGAYSETYYWQRAGTIAKPEVIYKRKAGGAILSFDKYYFTENAAPPYTSLVTQGWGYECNGDGVVDGSNNYVSGCRRVVTTYEWDGYANLVAEYQYGDYDLGGDERSAVRAFVPNWTTYVVGLPAYDELRAGIGKTGTLLTRTRFFYDGAASESTAPTEGKLTKKGIWNDQTGGYVEHAFGYDSYGNETSVTDPLGRISTRTYDATYHSLVTATTNPAGHVIQTGWDAVLGLPTVETDANGNVKNHYYDALGRATLSTAPDGAQVKIEYVSWGSPTAQRMRTSRLLPGSVWMADEDWFDGLGRPYKKTSSNGVIEETLYGATGKVWKKSLPYVSGDTVRYDEYAYDEVGRELWAKRPDGTVMSRSYDDGSVTVAPPTGTPRTTYLDGFGRITKARETIGGVVKDTSFYYDLLGRRTRSVDAVGYQTVATYDSLGRVIQRSDPDKGLWSYGYDALGRLTRETDALARATTLAYDTLGRVTRRTFSDATYESFTFDEAGRGSSKGRLTTAVASGVTTRAYYDSLGRRTKYEEVIDGTTYAISHSYDVAGRLVNVTYPDGEVVTYGYGTSGLALGRLTTVTGSVAGALVTGVGYTSKAQVATISYANGVTTTTNFDGYGERVSSIQIGGLATISYGYDLNGFVTSMTSPQLGLTNWAYGYDAVGRLTSAANTADGSKTEGYTFDAVGRVLSRTGVGSYTYGDGAHVHAVTAAGSNTYAYDANGNLTAGAGRVLTYGLNYKVASITRSGATTSFTYDAQGLRVKKVGSAGTVIYVGGVYESRAGAVTKYYFAGGARIAKRNANGNNFLHADHLGSTRLVTNASGAEVKRYEYAPWGTVIGETGTLAESHRFTGQEADDETGLMFFQARYYDPALGRFLQADAFLPDANAPQALDLYAYANNSPANYVDPSGHAPVVIAIAAWAGASAATIAAITAASTLINIAALVIGTALTFTNNPFLQTLGMIMTGMAGAALAGPLVGLNAAQTCVVAGAVALAQSPISPLDPSIKKVIGWGYTIWGGITSVAKLGTGAEALSEMSWGRVGNMTMGEVAKGVLASAWRDIKTLAAGWGLAYALSKWGGTGGRYLLAIGGRFLMLGGSQLLDPGYNGALAMVGATYDLAYALKYPDGRVYDLSGGAGGETFVLYCHTGYENPLAFGRQHIRVGDPQGGYWELGDFRAGYFGPGLGWAGWGSTQKITVILDANAAGRFRDALKLGGQSGGAYVGFHRDSYYYVSAALLYATGKSAADLHINPGLIHW